MGTLETRDRALVGRTEYHGSVWYYDPKKDEQDILGGFSGFATLEEAKRQAEKIMAEHPDLTTWAHVNRGTWVEEEAFDFEGDTVLDATLHDDDHFYASGNLTDAGVQWEVQEG